ncbi:cbb3-type cytochrome oxidase assembly protein CcoS [Ideonella livida]|nr:cbb3-type cytochrome oxidase assembly protein CcoS [Ideonella livida]
MYLLIPLSAVLVLLIIAVFGWALNKGQFDDLEREGERILQHDPATVDADQAASQVVTKQSSMCVLASPEKKEALNGK